VTHIFKSLGVKFQTALVETGRIGFSAETYLTQAIPYDIRYGDAKAGAAVAVQNFGLRLVELTPRRDPARINDSLSRRARHA